MMLKPTARPTPTADPTSISSVVTPLYDLAQTVIFLRHSDLEHSSVKLLNVARGTRGISGGALTSWWHQWRLIFSTARATVAIECTHILAAQQVEQRTTGSAEAATRGITSPGRRS